jgi:hypothetical protein
VKRTSYEAAHCAGFVTILLLLLLLGLHRPVLRYSKYVCFPWDVIEKLSPRKEKNRYNYSNSLDVFGDIILILSLFWIYPQSFESSFSRKEP